MRTPIQKPYIDDENLQVKVQTPTFEQIYGGKAQPTLAKEAVKKVEKASESFQMLMKIKEDLKTAYQDIISKKK
jgi:flagellar hook-basal body complex protein FliE